MFGVMVIALWCIYVISTLALAGLSFLSGLLMDITWCLVSSAEAAAVIIIAFLVYLYFSTRMRTTLEEIRKVKNNEWFAVYIDGKKAGYCKPCKLQ